MVRAVGTIQGGRGRWRLPRSARSVRTARSARSGRAAPSGRAARLLGLALSAVLLAPSGAFAAEPRAVETRAAPSAAKLANGLADLVAGRVPLDPRIPGLVAGYRPGEIAYFVRFADANTAAGRQALIDRGARVLRSYRSVPLVAVASQRAVVPRLAALDTVRVMAPVEVIRALGHERVSDQRRGNPADVGAAVWWSRGITGRGVTIAVLDTGIDAAHPDLDDLDFRHWSNPVNAPKIVDTRGFIGASGPARTACQATGSVDVHGHGTHVSALAVGTGEGGPSASDDGRHAGIAPGAFLAAGKVMTDAGTGLNSDLLAGMEWAAMPRGSGPITCPSVGAEIVNLSLGSESRPDRLNTGRDVDFVAETLDTLARRYGTLFTVAAGNSGPFLGSVLEAPGAAAQALTVGATAKDYDLNHDDTASGDTCSGWKHPAPERNDCKAGVGTQGRSTVPLTSRGPVAGLWLKPDVVAPGMNIVSAQTSAGGAVAAQDVNRNTRADPFYAAASGTSAAAPIVAGVAALMLQAYRAKHRGTPSGGSGTAGVRASAYTLLRAALMNSARSDLYESRHILTVEEPLELDCPDPDPTFGMCGVLQLFVGLVGSIRVYPERNGATDPFVGPFAEGAGKVDVSRAIAALRDGLVMYSAAATESSIWGSQLEFQGSWAVGELLPGQMRRARFVVHAAPGAPPAHVRFSYASGRPSDGSRSIPVTGPGAWRLTLPAPRSVPRGGEVVVEAIISPSASAVPGTYTGVLLAHVSNGQVLRLPITAAVPIRDPNQGYRNVPGPQARVASARDVYAKSDTVWPSVLGAPPTGAQSDWIVYAVRLGTRLSDARFEVYDVAGQDTYDLYLYRDLKLVASTHPFAAPGVTDTGRNDARVASTRQRPQVLSYPKPAPGSYLLVVSRARVGGQVARTAFGQYVLTLDEVRSVP